MYELRPKKVPTDTFRAGRFPLVVSIKKMTMLCYGPFLGSIGLFLLVKKNRRWDAKDFWRKKIFFSVPSIVLKVVLWCATNFSNEKRKNPTYKRRFNKCFQNLHALPFAFRNNTLADSQHQHVHLYPRRMRWKRHGWLILEREWMSYLKSYLFNFHHSNQDNQLAICETTKCHPGTRKSRLWGGNEKNAPLLHSQLLSFWWFFLNK